MVTMHRPFQYLAMGPQSQRVVPTHGACSWVHRSSATIVSRHNSWLHSTDAIMGESVSVAFRKSHVLHAHPATWLLRNATLTLAKRATSV